MKWCTQQGLQNQSSIPSLLPLNDWVTISPQLPPPPPPNLCKPRDPPRPSQALWCVWFPSISLCLGPWLHQAPRSTVHGCFVHWVTLPVRHHPVLVTGTSQGPSVLREPGTPGLTPWQPCHCSLITYREGHLSDRQLWKSFIKNVFRRKDRLLCSSDMLYLLWHETLFSFLWRGHLTAGCLLWCPTIIYRLFGQILYILIHSHSFIHHSTAHLKTNGEPSTGIDIYWIKQCIYI